MSSYWRNDEKIKVTQTQVSVPSVNGQSYAGKAGQSGRRVDFVIPPNVKFMDGKNTYLQFDMKIGTGAVPTRLQLDPFIGGQSVVKNLRIYSGSRGVLLEEISDYNCKVSLEYSYNQDESMRKLRALKEGTLIPTIENRGTLGTSVSNLIDLDTNPYYKPVPVVPAGRNWGTAEDFLTAKLSLPIHSGVFADSEKIFPVMLTQGLYIEIDLEDPARILKQLDSVNRNRRLKQNPVFHGLDAAGGNWAMGATDVTEIFLSKANNMLSVKNCGFVKGETIGICSATNPDVTANLTYESSPGAFTAYHPVISDITLDGSGFVKLTLAANTRNSLLGVNIIANTFIVYSTALDQKRMAQTGDPIVQLLPAITQYNATIQFDNFEIVCQKVELDPRYESGMISKMREGGSIDLDILSATNYKQSVLKSNRNATLNFPVSNTRAKASMVLMTDADTYNTAQLISGRGTYLEESLTPDGRLHSARTGMVGCIDGLSSYQWLVDNRLTPSLPVVVSKINGGKSISAQPLIELEKALNQSKIVPRSFVDYNRNFVIGRAYALNDGVANLNNKSNQLQLLYNETLADGTDVPSTKDKLAMCFVYHLRRITVRGDSVVVSL